MLITRMAKAIVEMTEKSIVTEYFDMLFILKDAPEMVRKGQRWVCGTASKLRNLLPNVVIEEGFL